MLKMLKTSLILSFFSHQTLMAKDIYIVPKQKVDVSLEGEVIKKQTDLLKRSKKDSGDLVLTANFFSKKNALTAWSQNTAPGDRVFILGFSNDKKIENIVTWIAKGRNIARLGVYVVEDALALDEETKTTLKSQLSELIENGRVIFCMTQEILFGTLARPTSPRSATSRLESRLSPKNSASRRIDWLGIDADDADPDLY